MNHIKNIRVEFQELPETVNGCVVDDEKEYIILINKNKNQEQQEKTYHHELEHIINNDLESGLSVTQLEYIRHYLDS